jgi:hypothetical protein
MLPDDLSWAVLPGVPELLACADKLRCVAVASGPFGSDALIDADVVARDAVELRRILPDLIGSP